MSDIRKIPAHPGRSKWTNGRRLVAAAAATLAIAAAGCGGENEGGYGDSNTPAATNQSRAFASLRTSPQQHGWHASRLPEAGGSR
jgi:hypothetical protein